MKTKSLTAISIITLAALITTTSANTRLDHVMWTDRGAANPPLSENTSTINSSIERFWNLPTTAQNNPMPTPTCTVPQCYGQLSSTPAMRAHHNGYSHPPQRTPAGATPNHSLVQNKNQSDRRGYFGINLFNMIPLIDIVHGSAVTTSSDHVSASR